MKTPNKCPLAKLSKILKPALFTGLLLFFCFPGPSGLRAETLNFTFTGTVSSVDNTGLLLDDSVTAGTSFQGFFVFDSSTPDSNSDATVGDYRHTNAITGIVVKVGSYVFRTNPQHVDFLIETVSRTSNDSYLVRSYNNVCSLPLAVEHITWQLDDPSGTALSSDVLPEAPPNLSSFSQLSGLTINGGIGFQKIFFIRGSVTNITAVPAVIPDRPASSMKEAVELSWPSALGYFYQAQTSNDLTNWTNIGDQILGDGGVISKLLPKPPGTNVYFRAEIANHPL